MVKKKIDVEYIPKDVRVRVRIEPAFKLVIEADDTGKSWSGHTWYGETALDVMRKMRTTLKMGDYKNDNLKVTSSTPSLVPAVSWGEPIFDDRD